MPKLPSPLHRRWIAVAVLLLATCATFLGRGLEQRISLAGSDLSARSVQSPQLVVDGSTVAPDFRALADETWEQFLVVFAARQDCFGDVHLRAEPALPDRAAYDAARATVTVRVPGTPALLRSALLHEWAHHIGFQCREHSSLRRALLAERGLPPDTGWYAGETWADVPAEIYAEAVVELVIGHRPIPTAVSIDRDTLNVVSKWASGLHDGIRR